MVLVAVGYFQAECLDDVSVDADKGVASNLAANLTDLQMVRYSLANRNTVGRNKLTKSAKILIRGGDSRKTSRLSWGLGNTVRMGWKVLSSSTSSLYSAAMLR